MGFWDRIGRPGKAVCLLAVGLAGGGAAWAVASVPDSSGVIHACYPVNTINSPSGATVVPATSSAYLRIIDPSAGQACNTVGAVGAAANEATLNFNQQGIPGLPGKAGAPGHTITINANGFTVNLPPVTPGGAAVGGLVVHSGAQVLRSPIFSLMVAPRDAASGQASGKRQHKPFVIVGEVDSATPVLLQAASAGTSFAHVTLFLTVRNAGMPTSYTIWHLTGVTVSHGGVTQVHNNELLEIELTFAKISYKPSSKAPPDDWTSPG